MKSKLFLMMFFTLLVGNIFAQPANDVCSGAIILVVDKQCSTIDVTGATQTGSPTNCVHPATTYANDVWFKFIAPATALTICVTPNSNYDAIVELNQNCGTYSQLACADAHSAYTGDGLGGMEIIPSTSYAYTVGVTYYIRVYDPTGSAGGLITVCLTSPPSTPADPTSNSPQCADVGVTLTRNGNPPANETWYWQGTSCDTSTSNSGATYLATSSGTYYIRSRNNTCEDWSASCGSVAVIVNPNPAPPTSIGNVKACTNTIPATLSATPPSGSTVDWYNVSSGGSPLISSSNTYSTSIAGNYYAESRNTTTGCKSTSRTLVTLTVNPLPTITLSGINTVCIGSTTTLTASGGASYSWLPSGQTASNVTVNPTINTTYTVTGTNANGCSNTSTVTVTVNSLPTITAIGTNTICLGNSTVLAASGGVTYSWLPSGQTASNVTVSPTATTTYTVSGTNANGCSNTASVSITVKQPPSLTLSSNSPLCPGSNLNLSANFISGASYLWTGPNSFSSNLQNPSIATATVADSGMYHCTITGINGCSRQDSMLVIVSTTPHAFITASGSTAICSGDSLILTATKGSSYLWSTSATTQSITVTTAGNYTCTVNSPNGCAGNAITPAVNVTVNPAPTTPVIIQTGNTLSSSVSGASYQWYLNGTLQTQYTTQFITITSVENGSWWVVVTNSFNCSATSAWFTSSVVGVSELSNNSAVKIYPNPTTGIFTLAIDGLQNEEIQIKILNMLGEEVYLLQKVKASGTYSKEINFTNAPSGIYSVQVKSGEKVYLQKLIKE